jgi:hypothetical protein
MHADEYRQAQAAAMSEADLQAAVLALATARNWRSYHTRDSRRSTHGFPDLVLVRHGRLVFAELKSELGRISIAQAAWLSELRMVDDAEVHVWRPTELLNGYVAAVLK